MWKVSKIIAIFLLIPTLIFSDQIGGFLSEKPKTLAFPEKIAGMAAWVKLNPRNINLAAIASVFHQAIDIEQNYVLGYKLVDLRPLKKCSEYGKCDSVYTKVYLYADKQGFLVAFLDRKTPAAAIVDFSKINEVTGKIIDFSLTEVLKEAIGKLGLPETMINNKVKFYNFAYPGATNFAVIISIKPKGNEEKKYIHIAIPKNFYIYEASLVFTTYNNAEFAIDGKPYKHLYSYSWPSAKLVSGYTGFRTLDVNSIFIPDKPHSIMLYDYDKAYMGLVIIYQR